MKQLIWDLPTRLFHWSFSGSILAAFALGKFVDKHSDLFALHMVFGALAGILLLWRIVWGFAGTRHARFSSLFFSPRSILEYFKSVFSGPGQYFAGHNPGSSVSILAMLGFAALAVATGVGMGFFGEALEEVHEVVTTLVIAAAAFHVAGVILATYKHREPYAISMFTGRKSAEASEAISSARPLAAALLLVFAAGSMAYLVRGFDRTSRTFQAPGTNWSIQFGENEKKEGKEGGKEGGNQTEAANDDDDDDDDR